MKKSSCRILPGSIWPVFLPIGHKPGFYLLLCISIVFGSNAYALNWEGGYGANVTAGYDDNFFLSPTNELDTSFNKLGLFASAEGRTEVTSVQLLAGINNDNYSDASIDDRTTGNLSLSLINRSERRQTGLDVLYRTEPTIETELLDTGRIVDATRDTLSVSPGISYQLDERQSISVDLGFTKVSYDTVSLTEYEDNSVSLGWGYRLSETTDFSTSLRVSQYDPENAGNTDTSNLNLGYDLRSTETTSYNFSVGYSDVDGPANSQTGTTYGVTISNIPDERNHLTLTAARGFEASGLGVVREEDRLGLSWTHGFSEKLQGMLSADFVGTDDRDYLEIQPSVSYRLSENLAISGNYRFRQQDTTTSDAESNSLLITLSYQD